MLSALGIAAFAAQAVAQANGIQTTTWPVLGTPIPSSNAYAPSVTPNVLWPAAPNAQQLCPGYKARNVKQCNSTLTADLTLAGKACNVYGTDIQALTLTVEYQNATRLNVRIEPRYVGAANFSQFLLTDDAVPSGKISSGASSKSSDLQFEWTNSPSFQFRVKRRSTGDAIFDTHGHQIVFQNQFLELVSNMVPDYNVYGLPEALRPFRLGTDYTQTFWNEYNVMNDQPLDANMHSVHPVYVETRYANNSSLSHVVFGRNMHGQEWLFRETALTYRAIGGSFDFYFFSGPTVNEALSQHQVGVVGTPMIPNYWTLGIGQNRWGFENVSRLQDVVDNFAAANIPLDIIYSDLDYLKEYRDFTNSEVTYPTNQFRAFIDRLHVNGQRYMPIVDPNIYAPNPNNKSDAYPPYDRLIASGALLRTPDGEPYYGIQWPGYSAWVDFLVGKGQDYWANEIKLWRQTIPWDGFWLDINDLSSWCTGSCGTGNLQKQPVHDPFKLPGELGLVTFEYPEGFAISNATEAAIASAASTSHALAYPTPTVTPGTATVGYTAPTAAVRNITFPPYALNLTLSGHSMLYYQIAPYATHNDQHNSTIYDTHNLYGHYSAWASYQAVKAAIPSKRPHVLSRSTSPGDGRFTGHWGGDTNSKFGNMYMTIAEALTFSIAGVPYFGVETCGFNGNADYDLCTRWMELSAFFPLYRNHFSRPGNVIDQYPYTWAATAEGTRRAVNVRYQLLAYQYTLFWKANRRGETVMRAVQWEFPNDQSLRGVDNQFMLGPSILITPVLLPGATTVKGVFPGDQPWYDWYTLEKLAVAPGENKTLDAPLVHIPVHIRGGSIIATQKPGNTTKATRMNAWSLIIAVDNQQNADGELYLDDGESLVQRATLNINFSYRSGTLSVNLQGNYRDTNALDTIAIAGYHGSPSGIKVTTKGKQVDTRGVRVQQKNGTLYMTNMSSMTRGGVFASDFVVTTNN